MVRAKRSNQTLPLLVRHPRLLPVGVIVVSVAATLWVYSIFIRPNVNPSVIYVTMSPAMQQALTINK
jgi:hypothetical protein